MRTWLLVCGCLAGLSVGALGAATGTDVSGPPLVRVAPDGEPGEPLLVEGRVVAADGRGLGGIAVYVYQTDARGYYSATGGDERNPRLRARLRTDPDGRYRLKTIKPGPYPGSGPPAHIHFEVSASPGSTERFELVFEGDPRLTPAIRQDATAGGFFTLCTPSVDPDRTLRCRSVDFHLR